MPARRCLLAASFGCALSAPGVAAQEPSPRSPTTGDVVEQATEGELRFGDDIYAGGLKDGRMHGPGRYTTPDGEVYEGEFEEGKRQGRGTLRLSNGDIYIGDFRDGEMHGTGRLAWSNGDVYEGAFVGGVRDGQGTLELSNGGTYVGGFADDRRDGLGHYRWRDGTLYKGTFTYGRQDGVGVKQSPDGELSFETWNNGELASAITVEAVERCGLVIDAKPWMFDGEECINGLAHGDGLAVALDGTAYVRNGRFILGKHVRGQVRSLEIDLRQTP